MQPPTAASNAPPQRTAAPRPAPPSGNVAGAIPLSAVAAGLAPDRAADTPTGGQIVLDALMEEHVARHAKAFYRSMTDNAETGNAAPAKQGTEQGAEQKTTP